MRKIYIDAALVQRQIASLQEAFPELADDETLRADVIEGETDLHQVLSRIAAAALDAKAMQGAIAERLDALKARDASAKRREEAFRALAHRLMDAAKQRKLILPEATLSITKVAPGVVITQPDLIPESFCRVKVEPNKTAIKEALKAGTSVPGAVLGNGSETLQIRGG